MSRLARHDQASGLTNVGSIDWWMRNADGRLTIAMWPNPAIWVWLVAMVLRWTDLFSSISSSTLSDIGRGALIVWAVDELIRGGSPFRRVLGVGVLAFELVTLFG